MNPNRLGLTSSSWQRYKTTIRYSVNSSYSDLLKLTLIFLKGLKVLLTQYFGNFSMKIDFFDLWDQYIEIRRIIPQPTSNIDEGVVGTIYATEMAQ